MSKILFITFFSMLLSSVFSAVVAIENGSTKKSGTPQALIQLNVSKVSEAWLDNKQSIAIVFSHNLSKNEDYSRFLTVTENGVSLKGEWVQSDNKKLLYLKNIKPENKYEIFIRPGIKASNGLKQLRPEHFSINTSHALPSIEFLDTGNIFSSNRLPILRLNSVNIKQKNVSIYRLSNNKKNEFIQKLQTTPDFSDWNHSNLNVFSELISEESFEFKQAENQRITSEIKLQDNEKFHSSGLYLISAIGQTKSGEKISEVSYFMISDFTMLIDSVSSHIELLSVSKETAKLISNVKFKLISRDEIVEAKTNQRGFTQMSLSSPVSSYSWSLAEYNKQLVLQKIPVVKHTNSDVTNESTLIFLNKAYYKIGDKLEFSVLLRDKNNNAISGISPRLVLRDSDSNVVSEQTMTTSDLGHVSGFFQLLESFDTLENREDAWSFEVYLGEEDAKPTSVTQFHVFELNYKNASLDFTSVDSIFERNEKTKYTLQGMINTKVPAGSASVVMKQDIQWQRYPSAKYKDFSFGIPLDETLQGDHTIQTVKLDSNGKSKFVLPKIKNKINSVLFLTLHGDLQKKGYPIASKYKELVYWPANNMVGVRTLNWGSEEVAFGVSVQVINVNPQDELIATEELYLKIYQLSDKANWIYIDDFGWAKEGNERVELIEKRTLSLDGENINTIDLALEMGNYRVEIENPVSNLLTSYDFSVGKQMGDDLQPNQLNLSLNKEVYQKEESAILSIESAFAGEAIIQLSSGDFVYQTKKINLSKGQTQLEVPFNKLKRENKKKVIPTDLQLSVKGFHRNGEHFFTSYGKTVLSIEKSESSLEMTLSKAEKNIRIHSNDYANINAVIIISRVDKAKNAIVQSSHLPLIQSIFFNAQGDAIVNNQSEKVRLTQKYEADLYFMDKVVSNVDIKLQEEGQSSTFKLVN